MILAIVLAFLISLSGLVSFLSTQDTLRKLRSGKASDEDLADYVGTWDRGSLRRLPGVSEDAEGRLAFDPAYLDQLPQAPLKRLLDSPVLDLVSVLAGLVAIVMALRGWALIWMPLLIAGVYQAAGWIWAARERFRQNVA